MTLPGPGDPETWRPYTGHPNDPRRGDIAEVIEHMQESDDWSPCGLPLSETLICDRKYPCNDCINEYIESKRESAQLREAGIE